ncbi:hypothetical protein [uncultured Lactobacillus sp.]|uniref:hypothetical protein n=1 Tax=uncultured Lactobacillus sp. TaxID=153152 RepID=UPI002803ADB9|nr:hypothetical protein [uncultured Lactobacillus sp.]
MNKSQKIKTLSNKQVEGFKKRPFDKNNICEISLDRITINGKFHAEQYRTQLKENHWIQQGKEIDHRPQKFGLKRISEDGELLAKENIATLIRNKGKNKANQASWRLDTSNHIENEAEKTRILNIINLFEEPRITRIDIAIDFINFDNSDMNYRFYKPNVKKYYWCGRDGSIETIYCGSSSSKLYYRYYNKLKEQTTKKKKITSSAKRQKKRA